MKILIADDDAVSRRLLESTLTRLGHTVEAVGDGTAAIAALTDAAGPRLAILDWMMPGADGLAVCRAVRGREAPYVYIILLTSRDRREDLVEALDAEVDDFLTKPFDKVELRARLRSGERVLAVQERLLQAQEALRIEATHDRLTGLWNRGMILDQVERELSRARRDGGPVAVVLADLDHFKRVNDTYGHPVGDAVLVQAAERMRSELRAYDAIGRYGGEEFLVVLPGADSKTAKQVAERARLALAGSPLVVADFCLDVTASLGVAATSAPHADVSSLIQSADSSLYRAKAQGRNRVEV